MAHLGAQTQSASPLVSPSAQRGQQARSVLAQNSASRAPVSGGSGGSEPHLERVHPQARLVQVVHQVHGWSSRLQDFRLVLGASCLRF